MAKKDHASGRLSKAECQRSGQKMWYRDLVEDGHVPGLLVHPDWWEPWHPQEDPVYTDDPIALFRPSPEISVTSNPAQATTPPLAANNTVAQIAATGTTQIVLTNALVNQTYGTEIWIALDAGGWHPSRLTADIDTGFVAYIETPMPSAAAAANDVRVGGL